MTDQMLQCYPLNLKIISPNYRYITNSSSQFYAFRNPVNVGRKVTLPYSFFIIPQPLIKFSGCHDQWNIVSLCYFPYHSNQTLLIMLLCKMSKRKYGFAILCLPKASQRWKKSNFTLFVLYHSPTVVYILCHDRT